MPHVVIDFSAGLEDTADMKQMCLDIRDALAADASIPAPKNIRVRARAHDYFATGFSDQSFAHADFHMLIGRDDATKTHMCELVLSVMEKHLPHAASLSVYPYDIAKNGSAKRMKE
ncbi:5-carboxymethyl-2-hydroxymuconate Delta-isomerase [Pacificibacter marinus]|uniref:5-carboxymethyl-2-hydroxymuconate Delta-isomerase n=1 Tax=Pacificibacter marinus TaxID=658057 RepID=UPI001C065CC7|nr:5-carboxymethyl-2-hydroxymuconate isomerase [Pacificibacter marinus]MBU2867865.1 5-carboxymethyl-2-hydroxymuconate isomerase [Pacificibacter marinus]